MEGGAIVPSPSLKSVTDQCIPQLDKITISHKMFHTHNTNVGTLLRITHIYVTVLSETIVAIMIIFE